MALTDTKVPYEILIRYGMEDGLPRGAHCQYLRRVVLDGELLKEEIGQAEPLDLEGFPTSAIMSDTTRDALAAVTRLTAERDQLVTERGALAEAMLQVVADKQVLVAEKQDLADQLAAMTAERDALAAGSGT